MLVLFRPLCVRFGWVLMALTIQGELSDDTLWSHCRVIIYHLVGWNDFSCVTTKVNWSPLPWRLCSILKIPLIGSYFPKVPFPHNALSRMTVNLSIPPWKMCSSREILPPLTLYPLTPPPPQVIKNDWSPVHCL